LPLAATPNTTRLAIKAGLSPAGTEAQETPSKTAIRCLATVGYRPFGLHIGVSAVVAFYMVSGYAMSAMWRRWYVADGQVMGFYLDRVLRLYPAKCLHSQQSDVQPFAGHGVCCSRNVSTRADDDRCAPQSERQLGSVPILKF
jgi:hypothetical protein